MQTGLFMQYFSHTVIFLYYVCRHLLSGLVFYSNQIIG